MDPKSMVRIRYCDGETGWAEMLGPSKARIDNVPMTNTLNIDDVVELHDNGERLGHVTKLLERPFAGKCAVRYKPQTKETYATFYRALEGAGMKVEGVVPGIALVAYAKGQRPGEIARDAGVNVVIEHLELGKP